MPEVVYNFDTTQWQNLKENIKNNSQPNRTVSFCTDFTECSDYTKSTPHGYYDYTNYYKTYSQATHSNSCYNIPGAAYTAHYASPAEYTQCTNYTSYANCGQGPHCSDGTYFYGNYTKRYTGHGAYTAHNNAHSNSHGNHNQTNNYCYNVSSCYNYGYTCNEHSRSFTYRDAVNFSTNIPNAPVMLGTESGDIPRLAKTVTIGLFAYDKDYNLSGPTTVEKEVYYDLYIQRIQDKDGTILTGQPLTKVANNLKESAIGEGVTLNLDTTAYPDGYYRFIAVSRNAPRTTTLSDGSQATYYMQDKAGTNITASGNYNGSDLFSGLSFPPGTRATTVSANTKKLKSGSLHEMVTVSKVLIKQNTGSFLSVRNATTSILNMIFANDDAAETDEGRYSTSANVKQVYGQSGIADGDPYIVLRGWTSGLVARIEVEEPDVNQYIKVTGTLYRKSDGTVIPGSTVTAQFPINKSSASAYTEIKAAGGTGVKLEGYLYWPASLFNAANLVNGLEDVEIRLTTYEYDDAAGTSLADAPKTTSSIETYSDGSEHATRNVFKVDKFSPHITNNAVQDTWLTTANVTITVDDRFLNNAVSSSGTSSNIDRILVNVVNRSTGNILETHDWSTANGVIPKNAKNFTKTITITAEDEQFYENIGLDIKAWDKVGNTSTQTISNIKIDNSTTTVAISPVPTGAWSNQPITPVINFSKPGGAPFTRIRIAETNSATPPADTSSEWVSMTSGLGTSYSYNTTRAGRSTNTHYVHVIVEDGLHPKIRQTFGPYKVDLEKPDVALSSSAGTWLYRPVVYVSVSDSAVGSKLKSVKYTWKKTNGSVGGTHKINLETLNTNTFENTYVIDIPDNTYENNITFEIEVTDNAGNVYKNSITNLRADKTSPEISINPKSDLNWHNTKINTITTVSKSTGAPCTLIKIAETNSPTLPADDSPDWMPVSIVNGGTIYPNQKTGQTSGEHYVHVWVEKGTFDPADPSSKRIMKTFGPYKVDLILPEMIDFEPVRSFVQKRGWYWEKPTFDVTVNDNGGSQMKTLKYILQSESDYLSSGLPGMGSSWINISSSMTKFQVEFPAGSHYMHVYMQDNALNEQTRTTTIPTNVDLDNPLIEVKETVLGRISGGKIVGYVNLEISAIDNTSGIRVAKFAITDGDTPPALNVEGNMNPENLGRTNGWIDFSLYSDIGVSVDLRAPGKSYLYIYVEDNAGRKYNSVLATVDAPDVEGIYVHQSSLGTGYYDLYPTYLQEITVAESSEKLIVNSDDPYYRNNSTGIENIYAVKNLSNIVNLDLHYENYQGDGRQQTLKIDILDCKTGDIVRSTKTLVVFQYGNTQLDEISPYNFPVWLVDGKTGQKLQSGVYEIRASLLESNEVMNSISAYIVVKQSNVDSYVVTPDITLDEGNNEVVVGFTEDKFYDYLLDNGYSDSFITDFIRMLKDRYQTVYEVSAVDRNSNKIFGKNGVWNDMKNPSRIERKQFMTVIAEAKDAFGNVARNSKVFEYFGNLVPGQNEGEGSGGGTQDGNKSVIDNKDNITAKVIETPSAKNIIINTKDQIKDTTGANPFDFLKK